MPVQSGPSNQDLPSRAEGWSSRPGFDGGVRVARSDEKADISRQRPDSLLMRNGTRDTDRQGHRGGRLTQDSTSKHIPQDDRDSEARVAAHGHAVNQNRWSDGTELMDVDKPRSGVAGNLSAIGSMYSDRMSEVSGRRDTGDRFRNETRGTNAPGPSLPRNDRKDQVAAPVATSAYFISFCCSISTYS